MGTGIPNRAPSTAPALAWLPLLGAFSGGGESVTVASASTQATKPVRRHAP